MSQRFSYFRTLSEHIPLVKMRHPFMELGGQANTPWERLNIISAVFTSLRELICNAQIKSKTKDASHCV